MLEMLANGGEYVIDKVLEILKDLQHEATKSRNVVQGDWDILKASLDKALAVATMNFNNQLRKCNNFEA
jgi:hypothetical protein